MRIRPRSIALFAAGCLAASAVWLGFFARQNRPPAVKPEVRPPAAAEAARWSPEKIAAALKALEDAADGEVRLQAAIELGRIPVPDIAALLDSMPVEKGRELSLACKTLLIRWAASDGEAAANWAWSKLYKEGKWTEAFREIGSSWAWHDPAGLYQWAQTSPRNTERDAVAADRKAAESERPLLGFDDLDRITRWIITEEPQLAMDLLQKRGGFSTSDRQITDRLQTPEQIQEALLACKGLDDLKPNVVLGNQWAAWSLLQRWKELDPKGFTASKYGHLIPTTDFSAYQDAAKQWAATPAEDRAAAANRLTNDLTGMARSVQINSLARQWAAISPDEAARWLDSLPDGRPAYRAIAEASASVDLAAAMAWTDGLPAADREASRVQAFDAWATNKPGQQPDMSGWQQEWIEAWKDLEAVGR